MINLYERQSVHMISLYDLAFKTFAETLDYPIADVKVMPSSKPFTFILNWRCATMWETGNAFQIRQKFQEFSLDLFKSLGYITVIEHPEALNA